MKPWLIWTWLAVLCWGIWAVLSRLIGDALNAAQQQALSTLGLLPILVALAVSGRLTATGRRRRGLGFAVAAGALTCLGNIAYYEVLGRGTKAATVVPLTALYPLVTILLAVVFLRERLNGRQIAGIGLSLVAIYLFNVQEEGGFLSAWLLLALVPIAFWGVAALLQKLATGEISGELATLWFLAAFVPVAVLLAVWQPPPFPLPGRTWLQVILMGFAFALGNFALLAAFARDGKASVIAPLAGLYPLVSLPIAIVVLGERPGLRETAGIVVALLAVFALSLESPSAVESPSPHSL